MTDYEKSHLWLDHYDYAFVLNLKSLNDLVGPLVVCVREKWSELWDDSSNHRLLSGLATFHECLPELACLFSLAARERTEPFNPN